MPEHDLVARLNVLHQAVTGFATTLMAAGTDHLEPGLRVLLQATGADAISIERETIDDDGVSIVSEARVDRRSSCDGPMVEARVPVCAGNRVVGEVVFAGVDRAWSSDEITVLRAVGDLIGGAWQRRDQDQAERVRSDAVARARDLEVRTSRALVACARTLLVGESEVEGRRAIESLRQALRAAVAYVDPVPTDVDDGADAVTALVAATPEARESGLPLWLEVMPWNELPGAHQRLTSGEAVVIGDPDSLEVRALGRSSAGCPVVKAEMAVPITVRGRWTATLGIADTVERYWTPEQRAVAEAVGELFGAYFERRMRMMTLVREIENLRSGCD